MLFLYSLISVCPPSSLLFCLSFVCSAPLGCFKFMGLSLYRSAQTSRRTPEPSARPSPVSAGRSPGGEFEQSLQVERERKKRLHQRDQGVCVLEADGIALFLEPPGEQVSPAASTIPAPFPYHAKVPRFLATLLPASSSRSQPLCC